LAEQVPEAILEIQAVVVAALVVVVVHQLLAVVRPKVLAVD
jgi:hypothetical protein